VTIFAAPALAARLQPGFPASLDGARFLLPTATAALRRDLERWFDRLGVRPRVVGEFDDSALLKVFGQAGTGVFAAPSVVGREISRQYRVKPLGEAEGVVERYFAISVERRIKHPGVLAISTAARNDLFSDHL